ncbi:MAG: hypothetical protein JNL34_09495 [Anaerolineae bacterium]|nr:hypothetical protein [Anaerolineae bacterium]
MLKKAAWIIVVMLWGLILASSLFTRIEADDYCFAATVKDAGILGAIPRMYHGWSGLYTDHLVSGLFAAVEPYATRVGVPLMLGAFVFTWWYALAYWYKRSDALLLTLAFGAALAMSRPNDEPIYWISGITSYWFPFAGVGLLIGALLRKKTALAAVTAFLTVALTDIGGGLIVTGLGLAFLFWEGERRRVLMVLVAGLTGYLIVFVAPGNAVRRAAFVPVELTPYYIVRVALAGFATNAALSFLFSVVPGIFFSGIGALLPPHFHVRRLPLLFLGLVLGASLATAVVAVIANGWGLGERAIYLLTPLWLAQWFVLGALIGKRFPSWGWMAVVAGVVLIVVAGRHVVERAAYAQRWDERHAAILAGYRVRGDIGSWDTLTDTDWALACAEAWYDREIRFVDGGNVP